MKQLFENVLVQRLLGKNAVDDSIGTMAFSGSTVEAAIAAVEQAILNKDVNEAYDQLDRLTYLIELEFDRLSDGELTSKPLVWRTSVLKMSVIRTQNAAARIAEFSDMLAHKNEPAVTLLERQLRLLEAFADLTRHKMIDTQIDFTPETWCKSLNTDRIRLRHNLGVVCYSVSRLVYAFRGDDPLSIGRLSQLFEQNFDLMLYAFSFGPLLKDAPEQRDLLEQHFANLEQFVSQPQPPIATEPDLFLLGPENVQHVLAMRNQMKEVLA